MTGPDPLVGTVISCIEDLGVARGSQLFWEGNSREVGTHSGIALYYTVGDMGGMDFGAFFKLVNENDPPVRTFGPRYLYPSGVGEQNLHAPLPLKELRALIETFIGKLGWKSKVRIEEMTGE